MCVDSIANIILIRCSYNITDVLLDDSEHISSSGFSGFSSYEMGMTPNSNSGFSGFSSYEMGTPNSNSLFALVGI